MLESVIVVVEDEPGLLELVGMLLRDEGYAVLSLHNSSLLPARLTEYEPRLFLLDLMLPVVTGIELAQQLRAEGHPSTPIVAMSASDHMLDTARDSGLFHAIVKKPFDLDHLLHTIERHAA